LTALWPALRMAAGGGAAPKQAGGVQARVFDQSGPRNVAVVPGAANLSTVRRSRLPWDAQRLADWIDRQEAGDASGGASVITVLALFDALGEQVADEFWLRAQTAQPAQPAATALPPADVWIGLQRAAEAGRIAETALYALLTVGEGDAARLHPVALHSVVAALQRVGLPDAARALALEVAVPPAP